MSEGNSYSLGPLPLRLSIAKGTSFLNWEHNPKHRLWSVKRFCGQFRKLVSNVEVKRRGSGPREYEFPPLNDCKSFFADKYSLDSNVFEIN